MGIPEFLTDVRKMFRNCLTFHEKGSEFYVHGKTLEEFLDKFLEQWLPDFAYETYETLSKASYVPSIINPEPSTSTGKKLKHKHTSSDDNDSTFAKKKHKKSKKVKKSKKHKKGSSSGNNDKKFINDDEDTYDED